MVVVDIDFQGFLRRYKYQFENGLLKFASEINAKSNGDLIRVEKLFFSYDDDGNGPRWIGIVSCASAGQTRGLCNLQSLPCGSLRWCRGRNLDRRSKSWQGCCDRAGPVHGGTSRRKHIGRERHEP